MIMIYHFFKQLWYSEREREEKETALTAWWQAEASIIRARCKASACVISLWDWDCASAMHARVHEPYWFGLGLLRIWATCCFEEKISASRPNWSVHTLGPTWTLHFVTDRSASQCELFLCQKRKMLLSMIPLFIQTDFFCTLGGFVTWHLGKLDLIV
jgi:hypothetical protein